MSQFLDDRLIAQAREARDKLAAGAAKATDAIAEVEALLREFGFGVRLWLPVGVQTVRGQQGTREVTLFVGYTDEGDGQWGVKLKASDPRSTHAGRFVRLASCAPAVQVKLLPKVKALVRGAIARARALADAIEQSFPEENQ